MSAPRPILLRNGRLICPASGLDKKGDLLLAKGRVEAIGGKIAPPNNAKVIDCAGKVVAPGFIDLHVHLREPGQEYKETIATGTASAAAGGFTAVCCMPNTEPVNDSAAVTEQILERAAKDGSARVYPVGAITPGLGGQALTQMAELQQAGCVGVTDDGHPVSDSRLLRRAMEYASGFDLPVVCHSEELALSAGGAMHEGPTSTRLGLPGIPAQAEVIAVERDLALAGLTGARVHICHISCAGSVEALKRAKEAGWAVSGETAPHYLALCDQDVGEYDTHRKMNPPLRSAADREAVRRGLADGVIDAVATDHAPHSVLEKELEFGLAAFGVTGLETALGILLELVDEGLITLPQMIERLTASPARILSLPGGSLAKGGPADVCVFDPAAPWVVEPGKMRSMSKNTPFAGRELPGRAVVTICGGKMTHQAKE
ncbi:MAG: dihydroorotase [Desulfarculaceae bacterium]|nr:dihydroorotase [Desulfarculaceae bacterium]MCF8072361.1 dihydroorotase [Desulfarculaceae bacterium]MCF8100282.1 dihydroorotase [Desulfarculaceae bacterium]MCF8116145.1 dihydroorotase [Desulfarculaceae bacterium]